MLRLASDLWGFQITSVLAAALQLDVFKTIASRKRTASEIAEASNASTKGIERLLDALVALKYLKKSNHRYALQPIAEIYLVRGRPLFMENSVEVLRGTSMLWSTLADAVKGGGSVTGPPSEEQMRTFFPMLVKQIFPLSYTSCQSGIRKIPKDRLAKIGAILDIGGGAGGWSIPLAQKARKARVTLIDFPEMTAIAREYAARYKVGDRFSFIEGNFFDRDWGRDQYDLAILGHILHGEGVDSVKQLLRRAADALNSSGMLLIGEMIPNDDRSGPVLPLLFGLNMLVATAAGGVYTMSEYRSWLKEAGFKRVTTIAANAPSPLILASK